MTQENTQAPILATAPAGEDIKIGKIVTLGSDNRAYWALDPAKPNARFRPIYQAEPVVAINEVQNHFIADVAAPDATAITGYAMATFLNSPGKKAIAYSADGNIVVTIINNDGTLVKDIVLGENNHQAVPVALTPLNNNTMAVGFYSGNLGSLTHAIVTPGGDLIGNMIIDDADIGFGSISMDTLANGGFVIGYSRNGLPAYKAFDVTGTTCVSSSNLSAGNFPIGYNQSVSVSALKAGGFIVAYSVTDGANSYTAVKRFNAGYTLMGSEMKVGDTQTDAKAGGFVYSAALDGGGFAVGTYAPGGSPYQMVIYNANGQIALPTPDSIKFGKAFKPEFPNHFALAGLIDGNLAVLWNEEGNAVGAVFDPTGQPVSPRVLYGPCTGSVQLTVQKRMVSACVAFQNAPKLYAGVVNNKLFGQVTELEMESGQAQTTLIIDQCLNPEHAGGNWFIVGNFTDCVNYTHLGSYTIDARLPIGVSVKDAVKGAESRIATTGTMDLDEAFDRPYAVDANKDAGQRFCVIGKTITLKGIQS